MEIEGSLLREPSLNKSINDSTGETEKPRGYQFLFCVDSMKVEAIQRV